MKRISNNYQCTNVTTETYTGKEMSPKGMGLSAIGFDIGFEKEGVDKQLWVVQMKNNRKVWFKKSGMPKVSHEEPLITGKKDEIIVNESQNIESNVNDNNDDKSIDSQNEGVNKSGKKTDFNIFYKYYSNKLKQENKENGLNKKPKTIQEETYAEWNRIKKNKGELNELLLLINNKA